MNEEKQRPIMSRGVVNSGNQVSIAGYLNWSEATMVILSALGFSTLAELASVVVRALADNVDAWYSGPGLPVVVWALGMLASYFGTRKVARRMKDSGESGPILFSKDETDD